METNEEIPTLIGRTVRLVSFHAADARLDQLKRRKANGLPVTRGEIAQAVLARTEAESNLRMRGVEA